MAAAVDIGTLIVRTPGIRGGRPRVAGTGISVMSIVSIYKMGLTPEEIAVEFPNLSLAGVHAAISYYHANQQEVEADLAEETALYHKLEQAHPQTPGDRP